jgi:hypothetical protein
VCVDRHSGKFLNQSTDFRCYAASAERFPAVRESRWNNFDAVKSGKMPEITEEITLVRIHGSGDFYSQEYFERWILLAEKNPLVQFWAFTKSIPYWINNINNIPKNFELQASVGGKCDYLIQEHKLKSATVFKTKQDAINSNLPIDTNDFYAANDFGSFALIDNNTKTKS